MAYLWSPKWHYGWSWENSREGRNQWGLEKSVCFAEEVGDEEYICMEEWEVVYSGCGQNDGEPQRHSYKCKLIWFYITICHFLSFPNPFISLSSYSICPVIWHFGSIQSFLGYMYNSPYCNSNWHQSSISLLVFLLPPAWLSGQRKEKQSEYTSLCSNMYRLQFSLIWVI